MEKKTETEKYDFSSSDPVVQILDLINNSGILHATGDISS